MPDRKPWTDKARKRIQATLALEKLEKQLVDPDALTPEQAKTARWMIDKVLPTLKAVELEGSVDTTLSVGIVHRAPDTSTK